MWAWTRSRSRPASLASATSRRQLVRRWPRRAPCGVGPWLAPFRNRRSPLTVKHPVAHRTWRRPVRSARAGRLTDAVGERRPRRRRRAAAGRRARAATTAPGRSTVSVHSTWFSPAASVPLVSLLDGVAHAPSRWWPRPARPRRAPLGSATTARASLASRHSTRRCGCGPGRSRSRRTGRQIPPGFQSGSRQSQCWNTPVMLRLAVRSRLRGAGRPRRRARARVRAGERLGDLERVREEVALGVAEVGAVEPDVALVEDAVERPASCRRRPGRRSWSKRVRYSSGPSRVGERRRRPPVAGHLDRLPVGVVEARRASVRRSSSSATSARHVPDSSMAARRYRLAPGDRSEHRAAPIGRRDATVGCRAMSSRAANLGQLKESGWESVPVKEEVRRNADRAHPRRRAAVRPACSATRTRCCRSSRTRSSPATT